MKKVIFLCFALCCLIGISRAQDGKSLNTQVSVERINDSIAVITIKARVEKGLQLFTTNKLNADDPFISQLNFDSSNQYRLIGIEESSNKRTVNTGDGEHYIFEDSAVFTITIKARDSATIKGSFIWLAKKGDEFPNGVEDFRISIPAVTHETSTTTPEQQPSLWAIFFAGLIAGLGALASPCIYAMLPITVSFFTKRSKTRSQGLRNAFYYSLSIILIFTLLGFLITLIFGTGALNALASSAAFNIIVFLMFLIFGISFLGAFEISLPSSWASKMDTRAGLGSFSGIFFLALTLVIVSFSCTVPFIGALTVFIAEGGRLAPLVGFFGFSLALAVPFAFFALFPGLINHIAKSGGWLNTIKVTLGFLEIALSLKFLSSADLAYHWRILDREVYLSIWIVIFGLLGMYLLGKFRLSHDDELPKNDFGKPYVTLTRLFFAIATFSFTLYMVPGLWGAPLNGISAWLPEMKTQDFNLYRKTQTSGEANSNNEILPTRYTDILESEIPGVTTFFDYEEGMAAAKKMNKPVMIDFTGHACANCRKMEREVLSDPSVTKLLKENFVVISLYVDDRFELPADEWSKDTDGNDITTMGEKNLDFEIRLTRTNAQPQYVFLDLKGNTIENAGGYNRDITRFVRILEKAKAIF